MNIELLSFFTLAFVIAITPGPSVIYVVSYSLRYGFKAGIISTLGINVGSIFAILIAALGLSSLLAIYPNAINAIQIFGGFYVIYLARVMWLSSLIANADGQSLEKENLTGTSDKELFKNGFITSVLNPKDILVVEV
ncbi:MAG: hypothetical protein GKR96_11975 [Gammaproteobacteria bacterium]|nr:hypothetical protein [Gammaproteobacteria bacterium]